MPNLQELKTCNPSSDVFIADVTNAVVAICVVFVSVLAVGAVGVPVSDALPENIVAFIVPVEGL